VDDASPIHHRITPSVDEKNVIHRVAVHHHAALMVDEKGVIHPTGRKPRDM